MHPLQLNVVVRTNVYRMFFFRTVYSIGKEYTSSAYFYSVFKKLLFILRMKFV